MLRLTSLFAGLWLLPACSMLGGCASILGGGGHQPVTITSVPSGAQIRIHDSEGKEIDASMTPTRVDLNRGAGYFRAASYTINVKAPGYPERDVPLKAGFNGWYVGNLVFGGLIGFLVVDPLTGAMWTLPDTVNLDMTKPAETAAGSHTDSPNHDRDGPKASAWLASDLK